MGFDIGSVGDLSGWGPGVAKPTEDISNLTAHVDGGPDSARGSNVVNMAQAQKNLYHAVAIIAVAMAFLILSGSVVFKAHNF